MSMTLETAQALIGSIATALQGAVDAQNKLLALEKAIQRYELNLYQAYLKNLEEIRKNPPTSLSLEGSRTFKQNLFRGSNFKLPYLSLSFVASFFLDFAALPSNCSMVRLFTFSFHLVYFFSMRTNSERISFMVWVKNWICFP